MERPLLRGPPEDLLLRMDFLSFDNLIPRLRQIKAKFFSSPSMGKIFSYADFGNFEQIRNETKVVYLLLFYYSVLVIYFLPYKIKLFMNFMTVARE